MGCAASTAAAARDSAMRRLSRGAAPADGQAARRRISSRVSCGADDVYEGEYKAGLAEGRGVMRYADGDSYEGEWKAGLRNGRGVYRSADGDVFDGEWKADMMEGQGIFRFANGDVDSNSYHRGDFVGEGIVWLADGRKAWQLQHGEPVEAISLEEARRTAERLGLPIPSPLPADSNVYEGEYNEAGEREGRGVMRYADGGVYDGEWKAGKQDGRGIFRYAHFDVYEGEWKSSLKEGHGIYRLANGDVYDGEWKAGKQEGRDVYRYANDRVESGSYKQGADVGEGVAWLAGGQEALRLRGGTAVESISLEEARRTAERLGLRVPSPLPGGRMSSQLGC